MASPALIRVQSLAGLWQTLGVEEFPGIVPEQVRPSADASGPSTLSFQLQRQTDLIYPDLSAWTPCEVEVDGRVVWDGRIKETPSQQGAQQLINVNGLGYSSHWDDDALERSWVHQDLTAWQDERSNPNADLTKWVASPQVTAAAGQIGLQIPANTALATGSFVGVSLDLGPANAAAGIAIAGTVTGGDSRVQLFLRCTDLPDGYFPGGTVASDAPGSAAATNALGTINAYGGGFSSPQRYVHVFLYVPTGFTVGAADVSLKLTRIAVAVAPAGLAAATRYNDQLGNGRGGTSNNIGGQGGTDLRASDVILDAAAATLPLVTATAKSAVYRDEVLGDLPQSYWRLGNNVVPPAVDRTLTGGFAMTADLGALNNRIGVLAGSPPQVAGLQIDDADTALSLNGSTQYATTAASSSVYTGSALTVEAIVRPTNALGGALQEILRIEGRIALRIGTSNRFEAVLWTGAGVSTYTANGLTLTNGTIYHLLLSYDGAGGMYLRVNNGTQTLTPSGAAATGAALAAGALTGIGAYWNGTTAAELFAGTVDEISVYNYVLTATQATSHYQAAISRQYGGVQRTQYKMPHYAPAGSRTFREHSAAVNGLHNWVLKMQAGRNLLFQPQPSSPLLKVSPGVDFNEAGANDGEVIYNKCIVEGQDATGVAVRAAVRSSDVTNVGAYQPLTDPRLAAASFEDPYGLGVGTFDDGGGGYWKEITGGAGGMTLDTDPANAHTGSRSGKYNVIVAGGGARSSVQYQIPRSLLVRQAGVSRTYSVWVRANFSGGNVQLGLSFNGGGSLYITSFANVDLVQGVYTQVTLPVPADSTVAAASQLFLQISVFSPTNAATYNVDDFQLLAPAPTIVDRRNFTRTKILQAAAAIDQPTAVQLATAYLKNSLYAPFRGTFTVSSPADVLLLPGETEVPPADLLLHTQELVRIPVIDPDTGAIGRDGKIINVTYDNDNEQATVTVDDDRNNLQALMNRMAVNSQALNV